MNKTAELVKLWAEYETHYPEAGIDDFCHYFLIHEREKHHAINFSDSPMPPNKSSIVIKMLGRIVKLHSTYALIALKECGLSSFDEFLYLSSILNDTNPKKTVVIYANFNELSSGLLIIDRLKNKELVYEQEDNEDKRSKRLTLTAKGQAVLLICYQKIRLINDMFFKDMPEDDMQLCIQMLAPIEAKFASKWLVDKGKSLDLLV